MTLKTSGIAAIVICVAAVAWYLGSPLFIRTTLVEPAPATSPARSTASPSSFGDVTVIPTAAPPTAIATGELGYVDAIHNGTGRVLLIRTGEGITLRFENVAITNAPDVHVYLSRESGGRWSEPTSLYLGPLKATNGSFNYAVPSDADLSAYQSVVVWCRQFSVLVTWADLR